MRERWRSPASMPSSTASLERYGGSSATPVYATSVATARAVRRRTGRARRGARGFACVSAARTSPRSPRPARPSDGSRTARPSSRDHLLQESVLVNLPEDGTRLEQFGLRPAGDDPPVVEDDHLVRERDRGQPVGDDDRRPPRITSRRRGADLVLLRRVDRRRSRRRGSGCADRRAPPARSRCAAADRPTACMPRSPTTCRNRAGSSRTNSCAWRPALLPRPLRTAHRASPNAMLSRIDAEKRNGSSR